jgi:hypothetical protein
MKKPIDFNTVGNDENDAGGLSQASNGDNQVSASQEEIKLANIP